MKTRSQPLWFHEKVTVLEFPICLSVMLFHKRRLIVPVVTEHPEP